MTGTSEAASAVLVPRPRARGIEHDGVVAFHLLRAERARKKIAPRGCHLMHAFDVRGFRHGLKRCLIEIVASTFAKAAIRSAKVRRRKEISDEFGPRGMCANPGRERFLTGLGCLQECAWRRRHHGLPMASTGVRREIRIEPGLRDARDHSPRQS